MTPHWVSLPPPPFAGCMNAEITSYTVVHGTTIYISCNKPIHSTYAFDTVSREWRRLGSWTMPFHGRAEYVSELNLWFGLSADHPYSLCAFDLPSDDSSVAAKPPTVQHTWVDLDIPQSWLPWNINLINLGCGRFCIAKMFHSISGDGTFCSYSESDDGTIEDSDPIHGSFAIFTGFHMVRPRGKHDDVQMIKHKFMRFLNLVVENARSGLYSLRRIPANHLFYPSTRAAEEATAKSQESFNAYVKEHHGRKHPGLHTLEMLGKLPSPMFNFEPTPWDGQRRHRNLEFASLLGNENSILIADHSGHTIVFDADSSTVFAFPNLISDKGCAAISLSIKNNNTNKNISGDMWDEDSLYVMSQSVDPETKDYCFEVLNYTSSCKDFRGRTPCWSSLQPPPIANYMHADITSYTVVDSSTIYWGVSGVAWAAGQCHSMAKLSMCQSSSSGSDYPSTTPTALCACDLLSDAAKPPTVQQQHTWVDLDIPESWLPYNIDLINLGCGRFCVVKIFRSIAGDCTLGFSDYDDDDTMDSDPIQGKFAVLTGLQMVGPCGKDGDDQGGVRMIKHKSISMGRRRYLNLLVHNNHDDLYSLRRIPANRLFYPSARAAEAAAMAKSYIDHDGKRPHPGALHFMDRFRNFPCPLLNLQPTPMHHRNERSLDLVTLLGDDETKILTADNHGHTVLFDAASYSVVHFPNLNYSKGYDAMAVSINQEPDCLYVLNLRHHPTTSNHCFEVLSYGVFCERIPIWRSLPPPPFTTTTQTTITSYTTLSTFLPSSVALTPLTR
uniref:Uncharacterized protein n=1 Tax=Oryza nivara TaxID=4536 RepID=A0A0E0IX63_ORYNI